LTQQFVYLTILVWHLTETKSKEKQMADKGDKSQSTDFVPFDRVTKGGIPSSMPAGGATTSPAGAKAHFANGKKTVTQ
jgi:hypothetical protein